MARIAILMPSGDFPSLGQCTASGLRPYLCNSVPRLYRLLRQVVCDAVILSLSARLKQQDFVVIQRLRKLYPLMYIIAYIDRGDERELETSGLAANLKQAGVDTTVFDGAEAYVVACAQTAHGIYEAFTARCVMPRIRNVLPMPICNFVEFSIQHCRKPLTVSLVADNLNLSHRTLSRLCHRYELPGPLQLLSWSRLLVAAALLMQPGYSVDMIGVRLFGSPSALRNMLRRYVNTSPGELRAKRAFETTMNAFIQTCVMMAIPVE